MPNYPTINRIDGLSQVRRLPRAGKIRLGVKLKTQKGVEYPSEVPYFVAKEEDFASADAFKRFQEVYGDKPTEIDIMFPVEDAATFFPQAFKKYGSTGLICKGDGVVFSRLDRETGEMLEGECPTPEECPFARDEKGRTVCKRMANLVFILPRVSFGGVFQIDTSSFNSIVDINSAVDFYRQLAGRISMVPLKLRRRPKETQYEGKKATHYPMTLAFPDSTKEIKALLTAAVKVREVFDVFSPGLQLPEPDVETDQIPRSRQPRQIDPPADPPPDEPKEADDGFDEETPEAAGKLLTDKERMQSEGAAVAEMAKKAREKATADTGGNGDAPKKRLF